MGALLIPNKAALQFLQEAVDVMELRSSTECTICEFDACQYHLARSKSDGDTVSLSFKSDSNPAPLEKERITDIYASCAAVLAPVSEPGYQVTLQVGPYQEHGAQASTPWRAIIFSLFAGSGGAARAARAAPGAEIGCHREARWHKAICDRSCPEVRAICSCMWTTMPAHLPTVSLPCWMTVKLGRILLRRCFLYSAGCYCKGWQTESSQQRRS